MKLTFRIFFQYLLKALFGLSVFYPSDCKDLALTKSSKKHNRKAYILIVSDYACIFTFHHNQLGILLRN